MINCIIDVGICDDERNAEQKTTKIVLGVSNGTVDVGYLGKYSGLCHACREARCSSGEL